MALETIYDGNGTLDDFNTNFEYLEKEDISVAVKPSGGSYTQKTIDTHYTVSGQVVTFTSGNVPPNNSKVRIRRHTKVLEPRHTYYAGSSVTAASLNENAKQILYALEERGLAVDDETDQPFTIGTHNEIKVNSATNLEVVAGSITENHMAINSVGTDQYIDNSIEHVHLKNDILDGDNIQDNSINSEHYVDGSIDHVHLSNDCIDGDNIQDDSINSEHIAAGAVDLEHMSSESVDEDNLHISNAGSNGQYLQKSAGSPGLTWVTVPTTGNLMRQVQFVNGPSSQVFASTDGAWNTILSLSITTTTNDARVFIQIGGKPRVGYYENSAFKVGLFRDTTELYDVHDSVADNEDNYTQISGITWVDSPGNAGSYTYYYKLAQTQNNGSSKASILANYATMMLTELGPNP